MDFYVTNEKNQMPQVMQSYSRVRSNDRNLVSPLFTGRISPPKEYTETSLQYSLSSSFDLRLHDMAIPYEVIRVVYILCPEWLEMLETNL